ncbi:MAG TPA: ABC transporter substrate-binding protein [Blastocatellia bacterium]|jgi:peptide/nickel transport system substrate-binding protein
MRFIILRQLALPVLLALLWTAPACRSRATSGEHAGSRRGGEIVYRVSSAPPTFNYLLASDENSLIAPFFLMGGRLFEFDHKNQRYVPGLAESLRRLDDGKTVELTLRDGIKFSDGHPITAEDVVFTLRAIYDERTASPVFRDAMLIGNRQIEASIPDGPVGPDGNSGQSGRRLRLVFPTVVASPENYLSNLAVLPRHILEADFNRGALRDAYGLTADPSRVVTAGPFAAESATPGERVTLKRNPYYWKKDEAGAPLPYLDRLVIDVVKDANNAFARLRQGSLDIYDRLRPQDIAELRSQPGVTQISDLGPGLPTDHLWFNLNVGELNGRPVVNPVKRAWFNDTRFRQAVSSAIDRQNIASITLQGLATPLYGFVSPGNRKWVAADLPSIAYDLERSRALLREAGFTTRGPQDRPELYDAKGNRVEFTLIAPSASQVLKDMAIVIQGDLAQLGIKMQVAPIDFGDLQRRILESYDYDACLLVTSVSEPDPSSYTNFLSSGSPTCRWRPKQSKPATDWETRIDDLLAKQARETDPDRRRAAFDEIQRILAEQSPVIPIVARHVSVAANQRIGNYIPSVEFPYSLWNAEEMFIRR